MRENFNNSVEPNRQSLLVRIGTSLLLATVCVLAGCGETDVPTNYGTRTGRGKRSLNGTSALARMFEQQGHTVTSEKNFSRVLDKYDVIVWFPSDFDAPTVEQREFLKDWLASEPEAEDATSWWSSTESDSDYYEDDYYYEDDDFYYEDDDFYYDDEADASPDILRRLVFVGRDFDAEPQFWQELAEQEVAAAADDPSTDPEESGKRVSEYLRRAGEAKNRADGGSYWGPERRYARWFTVEENNTRHQAEKLSGPWAEGVTAEATSLEYQTVLQPAKLEELIATDWDLPAEIETWLEVDGQPFVREVYEPDNWLSRVLVINNGSFLLNAPLVNKENRKLAGKVVQWCEKGEPEPLRIAFLETDVLDNIPTAEDESPPTGLEAFTAWPLSPVIWHLAFLGIALCFCLLPIFGRPRELRQADQTDFGRHVAAIGKLLAATENAAYARGQVDRYRHLASRRD